MVATGPGLDPLGRPTEPTARPLFEFVAQPDRQPFLGSLQAGVELRDLVCAFQAADHGRPQLQEKLFQKMVEQDAHLAAVTSTRRLTILGAPWRIASGDPDDDRANAAAELVKQELALLPDWEASLTHLLDGVMSGLSVVEIVWAENQGEQGRMIETLVNVPLSSTEFEDCELRLVVDHRAIEVPAHKFIAHVPRQGSRLPISLGALRTAAIYWLVKRFGIQDWAAFTEVHGMPLRLGKYTPQATESDKRALKAALEKLGTDAAAIVPDAANIEFVTGGGFRGEGGGRVFSALIEYCDREMSKAILGQTLTTDTTGQTGTLSTAKIHEQVRLDYAKADARALGQTLQRDLFRPLVGFSMGWDVPLPMIEWDLEPGEDEKQRGEVFQLAAELGVPLSIAQIRAELGLDEPSDDEDTAMAPVDLGPETMSTRRTWELQRRPSEVFGTYNRANELLAQSAAESALADTGWVESVFGAVDKIAGEVDTLEQVEARLQLLYPDLDLTDITDVLARTRIAASFNGTAAVDAEVQVGEQ